MATHKLDEFECEEIYHALLGRKMDLDKRAKDLEERDGLPEAAAAVRTRIALYTPNGEGKDARPGLIRQFAPQHDIEAEARNNREERNADGQQDAFGGGAETGGGHPAGEVVPAPAKKPRRKKGEPIAEATPAEAPVDVAYEIIGEDRQLGSGPAVEGATLEALTEAGLDALNRLDSIAALLLDGPSFLNVDEFVAEASRVRELVTVANPSVDAATVTQHFQNIGPAEDNAHKLAYFVKRMVDAIRGEPRPDAPPAVLSFAEPGTEPAADGPAIEAENAENPAEPASEPADANTGAEVPAAG